MGHAVFVRCPHGHARVARIDATAAMARPGILAVLTARELAADGIGGLATPVDLKRPDGKAAPSTARPLLADAIVRHLGEPVVLIVAASLAEGLDAAALVEVDYVPLPAVTTCREALSPGEIGRAHV